MEVKEAVKIAKGYLSEVFADEKISGIGLEEIEFDDIKGEWLVTLGFHRIGSDLNAIVALATNSRTRSYRVVRVRDFDGRAVSIKLRNNEN